MNYEFKNEVINLEDQNIDDLNFYDPEQSNDVTPRFIVSFAAEKEGSKPVAFECQAVASESVLLELSDDISLILQNTRSLGQTSPEEDITYERIQATKAIHEFNLMAVKLGLIRPQLTEEQLNKLPVRIISLLADSITARTNNTSTNNDDSVTKSNNN